MSLGRVGQSAVGAASTMNLPKMANGGIVTSPTLALIGEAGPEAVVPLGKGGGMSGIVINISGGLGTSTDIANAVYENLRFYNQNVGPLRIRTA
jgi:phage-related minor tail protein